MFQLVMIMAGIDHRGEAVHRGGRTDAILVFEEHVYVVEMKFVSKVENSSTILNSAMEQIKNNEYAKPYLNQGKIVHSLGLVFTNSKIAYKEEIV